MDLDSRTLARELRTAFLRFAQAVFLTRFLFSAAALLTRRSVFSVLGLLTCGLMFRSLFQHDWVVLVRWTVRGSRRDAFCRCRCSARSRGWLLRILRRFLFLFFLFRLLFDSGQFPKYLQPFFRCLAAPRQLHSENLFDNRVELSPARIAQSFQLIRNHGDPGPDRSPLVKVGADFRERRRIV